METKKETKNKQTKSFSKHYMPLFNLYSPKQKYLNSVITTLSYSKKNTKKFNKEI